MQPLTACASAEPLAGRARRDPCTWGETRRQHLIRRTASETHCTSRFKVRHDRQPQHATHAEAPALPHCRVRRSESVETSLPSSGAICGRRATIMLDPSRPHQDSTRRGFGRFVRRQGPYDRIECHIRTSFVCHRFLSQQVGLSHGNAKRHSRPVVLCDIIEAHPRHAL